MKPIFYIVLIAFSLFCSGCAGCSQSGRRLSNSKSHTDRNQVESSKNSHKPTVLKMEKEGGVKYVWIEVNGLRLRFIFDTGASSICLSSSEASVLYRQGTLEKDDIYGVDYFQDATGTISAGTRINLKTVKIGDRILNNIGATVIDNSQAPLLLGQSALEKFGRISINYKDHTISFE